MGRSKRNKKTKLQSDIGKALTRKPVVIIAVLTGVVCLFGAMAAETLTSIGGTRSLYFEIVRWILFAIMTLPILWMSAATAVEFMEYEAKKDMPTFQQVMEESLRKSIRIYIIVVLALFTLLFLVKSILDIIDDSGTLIVNTALLLVSAIGLIVLLVKWNKPLGRPTPGVIFCIAIASLAIVFMPYASITGSIDAVADMADGPVTISGKVVDVEYKYNYKGRDLYLYEVEVHASDTGGYVGDKVQFRVPTRLRDAKTGNYVTAEHAYTIVFYPRSKAIDRIAGTS